MGMTWHARVEQFVTASMYTGEDALWITDRTGNTTLAMLRRYERDVRMWRELGETPVAVDVAIPEIAAALASLSAAAFAAAHAAAEAGSAKSTTRGHCGMTNVWKWTSMPSLASEVQVVPLSKVEHKAPAG